MSVNRATPPAHPALRDRPIYLDYNATTPVDPRVVEAMVPHLERHFGNPSSTHRYGSEPKLALDHAREQVAHLIGARAAEIVFTGSGSEADTLAVRGAVLARQPRGAHVITQRTEHPGVLQACDSLRRWYGAEITYLPVDADGLVDPQALADAIIPRTVLVSIMTANNETGTLQPIAELVAVAHRHGALFHTDAAQAAGKIPIDVAELGVDLLTFVGHKMYAPKGIAALYVRTGTPLEPLIYGGRQEHGRRAGTENVPYAVALGAAAFLVAQDLAAGEPDRQERLRDQLHDHLSERLPGRVHLNGHPVLRLPNTANLSIAGTSGDAVLAATPEIAASTGSACHAGTIEPSPVLTAMALTEDRMSAAIRFSVGRWTTADNITEAVDAIVRAIGLD